MKTLENDYKLSQIESLLSKYSYLSKNSLPGSSDAKVFQLLSTSKRYPNRKVYPEFYHWYIVMCQFSENSRKKWIDNAIEGKNQDTVICQFIKAFQAHNNSTQQLKIDQIEILQQPQHQSINQKVPTVLPKPNIKLEYTMDIILKSNPSTTIGSLEQRLQQQKVQLIDIKVFKQKKQIRIMYRMDVNKCQQLKDKISQWQDVENIQIRKDKKLRSIRSNSNQAKDNVIGANNNYAE